jgi:hypothetical protein
VGAKAGVLLSMDLSDRRTNPHPSELKEQRLVKTTSTKLPDIMPTTITGDMHSINKANFAILCWFGMNLAPRFTDMQAQWKHLYCGCDPEEYSNFMISPIVQIDRKLIAL